MRFLSQKYFCGFFGNLAVDIVNNISKCINHDLKLAFSERNKNFVSFECQNEDLVWNATMEAVKSTKSKTK